MKKIIIIAILSASLNGFAQDSKNNEVNNALKKMTIDLSLTVYQQDAILPILEAQMTLQEDSNKNPSNIERNIVKVRALSKQLDEVLTAEQKETRKLENNNFSN